MRVRYSFEDLATADLIVDATYEGGAVGHVGDDPIARLLPVGNQGGIRFRRAGAGRAMLVALVSSLSDPDWPDEVEPSTGHVVYYGDNKSPGRALLDTPRQGNRLLETVFSDMRAVPPQRQAIPPIFLFTTTGQRRDVVFRGLAVPGHPLAPERSELAAVWRSTGGMRFQNYRAIFTILDTPVVTRQQLNDWLAGTEAQSMPTALKYWITSGNYRALVAPRTRTFRSGPEQLPTEASEVALLAHLRAVYSTNPYGFEEFAARVWALVGGRSIGRWELTRPYRDGGRDATGTYLIGPRTDPIAISFALEAKCYAATNGVGVREMSRLISRIRHREFGVLVTTSYVAEQAYREIRDDGHPIVVIAAADIAAALKGNGVSTPNDLSAWIAAGEVVEG